MSRSALLASCLAAVLALPAFADEAEPKFQLEVRGDDGERVHLEIAAGWLSALVRHSSIECERSDNRRTRRMAETLDRRGEGSVYEFEDGDGDRVLARRSRGQLLIETVEDDGERAKVEMPWVLAECLMLGREPAGGLGRWLADEGVSVHVDSRDGDDRVRITVD